MKINYSEEFKNKEIKKILNEKYFEYIKKLKWEQLYT